MQKKALTNHLSKSGN